MSAAALTGRMGRGLWRHRGALAALAMRGVGVLAGFVVTFLIGRWYGPAANGQYAIVTQTAMFLSIVAVGGMDLAVVREFSRTAAAGRKLAFSTLARSLGQCLALAGAIVLLLVIAGDKLLGLMGREAVPKGAVAILCMILIARTSTRFLASALRSQSRFVLAQIVEVVIIPVGVILMALFGHVRAVDGLLAATAAAGIFAAIIGLAAISRFVSRSPEALQVSSAALWATALPLWGVAVTQNLSDWYALATVSAVSGLYNAGLFRVAAQFAMVFSLVSMGLFGTFATQISTAFHAGDRAEVARLAGSATRLSAVLMLPIAVLFVAFAPQIMAIIGPEFRDGATLLQILVVGQVAIALAACAGLVLALTGHPKLNLAFTGMGALVMLLVAPWAAHHFGAMGVAIFVSLIMLAQNVAAHVMVRHFEGINAWTGTFRRPEPRP